jgi:catechol 2,3-dioxygenase-like lactoylglutathione lyase family enzyme
MDAALADLAAAIEWPATPALAAQVSGAIRSGKAPRGSWRLAGWRPARRALVLGILAALLIAGLAVAVGISLGGLRILGSGEPPGSPLPPELVAERGLGERVTLDRAVGELDGLLVPTDSALGTPDHIYYDPQTDAAALAWADRPGLPADPRSGLGIVVTQFRADMGPETFAKLLHAGVEVEPVAIGSTSGYWIEGGEHFFFFRDADGNVLDRSIRLVGSALVWERDGYTVRVEGAPDLETARRIAESMELRR